MNKYMGVFNEGRKDWWDFYPVEERLAEGAERSPEATMMVDVGGGLGHQAKNLKRKFPTLPGRFIVQDLPQGFSSEKSTEIEFMAHDFTTEQPIKGKYSSCRLLFSVLKVEPCLLEIRAALCQPSPCHKTIRFY